MERCQHDYYSEYVPAYELECVENPSGVTTPFAGFPFMMAPQKGMASTPKNEVCPQTDNG